MALMDWAKTTARRDRNLLSFVISYLLYKVFYKDLCFGDAFLTQEEHTWC